TAEVADAEIDEAVSRIAEQNKPYAAKALGEKAAEKDRVTIDFTGSIDGKPFEGGTGGDIVVELGSGTFIPGFEEQLLGVVAGDNRKVDASFPPTYANAELAGKTARFDVIVKGVETPQPATIDDDFA